MSEDQIFSVVNLVALLGWVLLAVFPHRRWAAHVVSGWVIPALLACFYVAILVTQWGQSPGGFSSLSDVGQLFGNRWLLLAGWVHYLAFDLLVGGAIVRDAERRRVPHLLVVPTLALTFLFGPAGWLLYQVLRAALRARAVEGESRGAAARLG
jgi:hypothetical protein